ncbi:MAG: DNA polymerase III subunit gamma/tau [Muribaculaceae bacterium]|nr:DNA polymerase III subunit gamma/tau [Muribaculaceae bacterium]
MSNQPYIVSARKYRPADFNSVVGQKALTATLKNAVQSGRLAQAYLFCGPRGVGKTSCARIFAKTINCLTPTPEGEACGHCEACRAIEEGSSFNIVELDAASNNSVDDIRALTEQVNIPPTSGKYRVFIIDEVHMLSSSAFNAFLKTLEEPPSYVVFILATTEKHKVIPTILSRCQIYDFKRITIQDMVEHLQYVASNEGITADVPSLNVIAKKADGAMRDALSIFDQVAASSFGNITYESTIASLNVLDYEYYFRLVDSFRTGDIPNALLIYKEIIDHGFDSQSFINGLANHVRDLMVAFSPQTSSLLEVADDVATRYSEQAKSLPIDWFYAAMKILNDCDYQYRTSSNKQFLIELTLIRLSQLLNPPTPPFDRVDSDSIPLRDPATPHYSPVASPAVAPAMPSTSTAPASTSAPSPTPQPRVQPSMSTLEATQGIVPTALPPTATQAPSVPSEAASASTLDAGRRSGRRSQRPARPDKSTFRISATDNTAVTTTLERQRNPFTHEDVLRLWDEFIAQHPDKHILISAMRKARPVPENEETYTVTVDHPALFQAFESEMSVLIGFLRQRLANDFIYIKVDIDKSKEEIKRMPPQELLRDIIETNPIIGEFIADFDAELI